MVSAAGAVGDGVRVGCGVAVAVGGTVVAVSDGVGVTVAACVGVAVVTVGVRVGAGVPVIVGWGVAVAAGGTLKAMTAAGPPVRWMLTGCPCIKGDVKPMSAAPVLLLLRSRQTPSRIRPTVSKPFRFQSPVTGCQSLSCGPNMKRRPPPFGV